MNMALPCVAQLEENRKFITSHQTKDSILSHSTIRQSSRRKPSKPAASNLQAELLLQATEILNSDEDETYHCSECGEPQSIELILAHLYVVHHLHDNSSLCISCRNFLRELSGQPQLSPSSNPLLSPSNPYARLQRYSRPQTPLRSSPDMEYHPVNYPRDEDRGSNDGSERDHSTRILEGALLSPENPPHPDPEGDVADIKEEEESDEQSYDSDDRLWENFRSSLYSPVSTAPAGPAIVQHEEPDHEPVAPIQVVNDRPPKRARRPAPVRPPPVRIYRTRAAVREGRRSPIGRLHML